MRTRIIFISLFIIVAGILAVVLINSDSQSPSDKKTTQITVNPVKSLDIKNLYLYSNDINITTQSAIKSSMYKFIEATSPKIKQFTGLIRKGTYSNSNDGTLSTTDFLVDIEALKQTYKVSFGSDGSTGENSLYILCPTDSELIYPAFECKADSQ